MPAKILVLTARGTIGSKLVPALLASGEQVKAATRSGTPVSTAEPVAFDYEHPSAIVAALAGVDRIYAVMPVGHTDPYQLLKPVLARAAERGVKIVLQTAIGVDADDITPYRGLEIYVQSTGTPYVFLRPNWFADNFRRFWLGSIHSGELELPAGDGKTSFIDARDIADCAARVLTTSDFDNRAFTLTGPQALSYAEAVAILSRVLGRQIIYRPIDDEAFIELLKAAGAPEDYAGYMATLFRSVREGRVAVVTGDVEELTGHPARSLETYVRDNAAAFS